MATPNAGSLPPRKPLRLWPGVVTVVLQWLPWLVLPIVAPQALMYAVLAGAALGLVIVVWWLFFSRAPWIERVCALVLMPLAVLATRRVVHPSVASAGMGVMLPLYSVPLLSLALVAWAAAGQRLARGPRSLALVGSILLACGVCTLVRTDGVRGEGASQLRWRWTPTAEERLLAQAANAPVALTSLPAPQAPVEPPPAPASEARPGAPSAHPAKPSWEAVGAEGDERLTTRPSLPATATTAAEWPGFRGPARDGVVPGVRIATDWAASPPVELWRRPIGPGWSSFAVDGGLAYTQEQRGEDEVVSCYRLSTGEPVWTHRDPVRFWESNAGAGPRATPTLAQRRVYTLGATGILNALDAASGAVVWSRHAATDTRVEVPVWGFTGSPLVVGDAVIVATSGRLAAYDAATGKLRWLGPDGGDGYSSPHLATFDGVAQVLLLRGARSTSVAPADGSLLLEHRGEPGASILQPSLTADGDVLVAGADAMGGTGIRRLAIARGPGGWTATERWLSKGLKPYFSDFVVHRGHAYGFDGSILSCIDLADGARNWKGGRYGHGQLLLLPEQDLLLVLSEEGELALVGASPGGFTEIARVPAIAGKTWNHPVVAGDTLLVRNGEEMAAFRLPTAATTAAR
jgi:outer membrane protein assembly factor BamB